MVAQHVSELTVRGIGVSGKVLNAYKTAMDSGGNHFGI
jgi:hypothetical protein